MDDSSDGTDINVRDTLSLILRDSELCNSGVNMIGKNDGIVIGTRFHMRGICAERGDPRLKKAIRDLQCAAYIPLPILPCMGGQKAY